MSAQTWLQQRFDIQKMFLVGAAHDLGFPDALQEPMTAGELAAVAGTDQRATRVMLDVLAEVGYVERNEADEPRYVWKEPVPERLALDYANLVRLSGLKEVVRTGEPHGGGDIRADGFFRKLMAGMSASAKANAEEIGNHLDRVLEGPGAVLDAGGGPGVYAREFLRRGHRVALMDLPEVLEHVAGAPYHLGQTDIELIPGDLQEGLPLGSFDAIYLSRLCHMFGPEENRRLFQDAREALRDGGFLVIVDWLAGTGIHSTMFAVTMLLSTRRGSVWSLQEYEGWLEEAGFRLVEQVELSTGDFLMVAEKG